jgi:hypothetical protein
VARIKDLRVRLSAGEFLRIASAAEASGMQPSPWVRHQALRAADGLPTPSIRFHSPPPASPPAKLTHSAGTRFTQEQFEALDAYARACGLPVAAFIRQVVLGVKPLARRPEIRSAIVAVNRVGNNLNQLVKLAHTGVVLAPDLMRAVGEVLTEVRAVRSAFLRADDGDTTGPGS